jgi:hypothetical protein
MKVLSFLMCVFAFSIMVQAQEAGLSSGSEFQVSRLSGEITIHCPGHNPFYNVIHCSEDHMVPTEFDYFVGPKIEGATQVQLTSEAMDGKVKKSKYDSSIGKSTSEFNLWIRTLLQRPLLKIGANMVTYVLLDKNKQTIKAGDFMVNVTRGPSRTCPRGSFVSNWPEDCQSSGYQHCAGYFREYNYCQ